jgi:hypothetical protein
VAETLDRLRSAVQARKPTRRTAWRIAVALPVLLVGGLALLLTAQIWEVKDQLREAHHLVPVLDGQLGDADLAGARDTMETMAANAEQADDISDGLLWRSTEWLPFLGDDLTAVRQLSSALNLLTTDAALPLLDLAESPGALLPQGGRIDIAAVKHAVNVIETADAAIAEASTTVDAVDTSGTIAAIVDAKQKIGRLPGEVQPITSTLSGLAPMLPALLGADGPRQYAVMFQNLAENRALGGTALSFVVVTVDDGAISIGEPIPTKNAGFGSGSPVIDVPPELAALYGAEYGDFIASATVRPSYTSAAQTVIGNFARDKGIALDGVLSLDPVALGYLLRATGPIRLSTGDMLTPDTAVPLLLNEVYHRYAGGSPEENGAAQDALYAEAVHATYERLMSGDVDLRTFAEAAGQGWSERRILFYSAHDDEQARLQRAGLNGEPPVSDDATDRVGVYFGEAIGTKLTYYSSQKVQLGRAVCRDDGRASYRVTVSLTNGLDPVEAQVTSDSILGYYRVGNLPKGQQRMNVYVYAPPGSTIVRALVDGIPQPAGQFSDGPYPVDRQRIVLPAGSTGILEYDLLAATPGDRALEAQVSPMVSPTTIDQVPLECADVPLG